MTMHELKIWPEFFDAIDRGDKTFEIRKDDRGFRAGDALLLKEWLPRDEAYTGRGLLVQVPYIMAGPAFGLSTGFVCMSIQKP